MREDSPSPLGVSKSKRKSKEGGDIRGLVADGVASVQWERMAAAMHGTRDEDEDE